MEQSYVAQNDAERQHLQGAVTRSSDDASHRRMHLADVEAALAAGRTVS